MAEPARPFTPETLAEYWSCSAQHVRDLVRAGRLPAFRVGRLIRIRREDVENHERCQAEAMMEAMGEGGQGSPSTGASGASIGGKTLRSGAHPVVRPYAPPTAPRLKEAS